MKSDNKFNGEPKETEELEAEGQEEEDLRRPHGPRGHMFTEGKAKLDHPRNVLWKWVFSYLRPYKRQILLYILLLAAGAIIMSVTPMLTATIIDRGILPGDLSYVLNISIAYFTLMLIMAVGNYVGSYGMGKLGQNIVFSMRNDVFEQLQQMSMSYFDKNPSGDIISRATNDIDQMNFLVGGQLVQIISSVISIGLGMTFMFVLNWFLALISLSMFPIFFVLLKLFKKKVIGAFKETRKKISKVTSSIQENIAGAKVVQAYGQERRAMDEFDRANQANYEASFKARRIFATFFPIINFVSLVLTVVVLMVGGLVILDEITILGLTVTVGVLTAFIQYLAEFFRPIFTLTQIQQVIESAMAAADRIYTILEEEVDLPDPEKPVDMPEVQGKIEFQDVSFGYRFAENGDDVKDDKGETTKRPGQNNRMKSIKGFQPSGMPGGMNPMEMMQRVRAFIQQLPEPYKGFFQTQLMRVPQPIRQEMMLGVHDVPPEKIPAKIDVIFAKYGYAIPGTEYASTHPDLKVEYPEAQLPPMVGTMGMLGKPMGQKPTEKPSDEPAGASANPETTAAASMPGPGGEGMPGFNPAMLKRMVQGLAQSLQGKATMGGGGGMGAEMGGGGMGGRGPGGMSTRQILRMLASMPLPEELTKDFPEIVKKAIEEERTLLEHEATVGYVLKEVDHTIKPGETLAIVGKTGAGKTTMIKLICRFYDPTDGKILLDGIDLRQFRKNDLRRVMGLVPQDSFLFTGTIRENLQYGCEEGEICEDLDDRMVEVSKFLGLHNFIETLPKKYDTKLKENASNISIGQRQLIAFARALIQDPKVLILDEATSSVDPYTESLIQDALDRAREGRTTIIIAHRLSTIKNADWIIVLDQDEKGIVEQGTHDELIAKNGTYKHLLDMQYKDIGSEALEGA